MLLSVKPCTLLTTQLLCRFPSEEDTSACVDLSERMFGEFQLHSEMLAEVDLWRESERKQAIRRERKEQRDLDMP